MKLSVWFCSIILAGLCLTACGAAEGTPPTSTSTHTPILITPPATPTSTPEQWPLPAQIENIKIEQNADEFVVAFYLIDRNHRDTIGVGSVRFEITNAVEAELAETCIQSEIYPPECLLYRAEEQVSIDDFQLETWDRPACEPEPPVGCIGEHLTYRFKPLVLNNVIQPPLDEWTSVTLIFEGNNLTRSPWLEKNEVFLLKNGQFKAAIIEVR